MEFEFTPILDKIGEKVSEVSGSLLNIISEKVGTESTSFQLKILTLIFLSVLLLISFKIAHKTTKFILIILIIVFIISTFFSMFG